MPNPDTAAAAPPLAHSQEPVLANPHWTYFRLTTLPSTASASATPPLDAPTVRLALLRALAAHHGDHGAAVSVDILAIEPHVIVRVPRQDGLVLASALASHAGGGSAAAGAPDVAMRVAGCADWLSGLACGDGRELFRFGSTP